MRIGEEIDHIKRTTGKPVNNIEQFKFNKDLINQTKHKFLILFGYSPSISECVYVIENDLQKPDICLKPECGNTAKFNRNQYRYCCRVCSDTDINRNKSIQQNRSKANIDYKEVHKKVVSTKNEIGSDGLNVHQRSGEKTLKTRNENYDNWYEKTVAAMNNKSVEVKKAASLKRKKTLFEKYGVTHFGGGYSKIKRLTINGKEFLYQGYEDVALYELIFIRKIAVEDIESCVRYDSHKFKYVYGYYYPDLYIKSEKKYMEIKSVYWDNKDVYKELKRNSILEAGFNYEKVIYDDKGLIKFARNFLREKNCYTEN